MSNPYTFVNWGLLGDGEGEGRGGQPIHALQIYYVTMWAHEGPAYWTNYRKVIHFNANELVEIKATIKNFYENFETEIFSPELPLKWVSGNYPYGKFIKDLQTQVLDVGLEIEPNPPRFLEPELSQILIKENEREREIKQGWRGPGGRISHGGNNIPEDEMVKIYSLIDMDGNYYAVILQSLFNPYMESDELVEIKWLFGPDASYYGGPIDQSKYDS